MDVKPEVSEPLRECKFVVHVPKYGNRPDMHYIKEKIVHPDGRVEKNLTTWKKAVRKVDYDGWTKWNLQTSWRSCGRYPES